MMILGLFIISLSGCQQVNDAINSNKATNTNTASNSNTTANTNATTNTNTNSNVTANSNANANTSASPTNSAANTNTQASNTATAKKEEVPLTEEAKVFKNNLEGKWTDNKLTVTFTEDKYEVSGNFTDNGSYRVLDEKTVEINSVKANRKWNATMKIENGDTLDWKDPSASFKFTRVKTN